MVRGRWIDFGYWSLGEDLISPVMTCLGERLVEEGWGWDDGVRVSIKGKRKGRVGVRVRGRGRCRGRCRGTCRGRVMVKDRV